MTQADILKALHAAGYDHVKENSATLLIVFMDPKENRRDILEMIALTLKGRYITDKRGRGWKSSAGAVIKDNSTILCKPAAVKGASASLGQLDARVFSTLGTPGTFEYHGKPVKVVTFTSAETLKKSILRGIADSESLTKKVGEAYDDFFAHGKFLWAPTLPAGMIDKLGVYTGELLIGWVYLAKKAADYIPNNPIQGVVKAFHLPTDPQFAGVDSFLEMKDGSYYAISSKFEKGAAASFFANLMEVALEQYRTFKPSFFKTLCETARAHQLQAKQSSNLVYTWGARLILKMNAIVLPRPIDAYVQLRDKKIGPEAKKVVLSISASPQLKKLSPRIKEKLPYSVSAFFTHSLVMRLQEDPVSLQQITSILAGKDYWQANIVKLQWLKGILEFKILRSGQASLKLEGNKSSIDDITAKQGWINYRLEYH